MRRVLPLRSLLWLSLAALVVYVAWLPTPPEASAQRQDPRPTVELVNLLSNDSEAVEQAAWRELVSRGPEVIPALVARAREVRRYHRRMICSVLEEFLLSDDLIYSEAAEQALDELGQSPEFHIANDAYRILFRNSALRHARAATKFVSVGGILAENVADLRTLPLPEELGDRIRSKDDFWVVIDHHWTGTDSDLQQILRLYPGRSMSLYVTADAPVAESALRRLAVAPRGLHLRFPHAPCLGVSFDPNRNPGRLIIVRVVPESPAGLAGLAFGDELLQVQHTKVTTLNEVNRALANYSPGDRINLTLHRQGRTWDVSLVLGSDYTTEQCACVTSRVTPTTTATE